jgi:hypothetical protein
MRVQNDCLQRFCTLRFPTAFLAYLLNAELRVQNGGLVRARRNRAPCVLHSSVFILPLSEPPQEPECRRAFVILTGNGRGLFLRRRWQDLPVLVRCGLICVCELLRRGSL